MSSVTNPQLAKALLPMIEATHDSKKLAHSIAQYLSQERRTKDLDAIMRDITRLRSEAGIVEATVTSAFPITPSLRREIQNLIASETKAKKVLLNEVVNPDVLGGLRIEAGEQQLDTTIKTKLQKLKQAVV